MRVLLFVALLAAVVACSGSTEPDYDATVTASIQATQTALALPTPRTAQTVEEYASQVRGILTSVKEAYDTLDDTLENADISDSNWRLESRQARGRFALLRAEASALAPPSGWASVHVSLIASLNASVQAAGYHAVALDALEAGHDDAVAGLLNRSLIATGDAVAALERLVAEFTAKWEAR